MMTMTTSCSTTTTMMMRTTSVLSTAKSNCRRRFALMSSFLSSSSPSGKHFHHHQRRNNAKTNEQEEEEVEESRVVIEKEDGPVVLKTRNEEHEARSASIYSPTERVRRPKFARKIRTLTLETRVGFNSNRKFTPENEKGEITNPSDGSDGFIVHFERRKRRAETIAA